MVQIFLIYTNMQKVRVAEHLYQLYPSMPRYANDPEESEIIKAYDFIMRRYQGFFGKQPTYFIKASTSPLVFGDRHSYSGYDWLSFSSTQDLVVAVGRSSSNKIRINNYQSAIYGEKVLESSKMNWKFEQKEESDKFLYQYMKILSFIADELKMDDLGGIDILIYTGTIEDEFVSWREALYTAFYCAVYAAVTGNQSIQLKQVNKVLKNLATIDDSITIEQQLMNYQAGSLTQQGSQSKSIAFNNKFNIILAHSLTPLPKKLIQGKRFNLRRCEILIAIEYLKNSAGTTKDFSSLKQLQDFIGCSLEELIKEVEENVPKERLTTEEIEQATEKSLIDILKEVPYANNVIDQNSQFFPRERALFLLHEERILAKLTEENLVESLKQSYQNQIELLGVGSQQIEQLVAVGSQHSLAHKIVGNGWGGNVLFICEKEKTGPLIDQIVHKFYLSQENKILLSDDIEQYIQVIESPGTGLAIFDPASEIWY